MRPWLERLRGDRTLERLNALAEARGVRTLSGEPLRFVPPSPGDPYYEVAVFETGRVSTRPDNLHDFFNALAWLAFPRTKARINALHAHHMPMEGGRRGRFRDLLTIFDEGGALVECADETLVAMLREFRWKELFWEQRGRLQEALRIHVLGHAVLEQALAPRPGITCKVIIVPPGADLDATADHWLCALPPDATPKQMPPLPVFGYPGWFAGNDHPDFYDDTRYFRPLRRDAMKPKERPDTA